MVFPLPPAALAIAAAVLVSAWGIFSRFILKGKSDYLASGTAIEAFSALFLIAGILLFGPSLPALSNPIPPEGWLIWVGATIIYTAFIFITYKAGQTAEATERAVVNQLQIPWALLLAFAFLSESVTQQKLAGAACIIGGALLCTYRPGAVRWKVEGVRLIAFAAILAGTASIFDKAAMGYFPPLLYALPLYIVPSLLGIAWLGETGMARIKKSLSTHLAPIALAGFVSLASYILFLLAMQRLPASETIILYNTNIVLVALGGMLFLSEKEGWRQKILGGLLAFLGAALVAG